MVFSQGTLFCHGALCAFAFSSNFMFCSYLSMFSNNLSVFIIHLTFRQKDSNPIDCPLPKLQALLLRIRTHKPQEWSRKDLSHLDPPVTGTLSAATHPHVGTHQPAWVWGLGASHLSTAASHQLCALSHFCSHSPLSPAACSHSPIGP